MANIISILSTVIFKVLLFIAILFSLLFATLLVGITFDKIAFANVDIRSLHLGYDDGLVATAKQISITLSDEPSEPLTGNEVISIANRALFGLGFVNRIDVEHLSVADENLSLHYGDSTLGITHKDGKANANFTTLDGQIVVTLSDARYLPLDMQAKATLLFDPYANRLEASADIVSDVFTSSLDVTADKKSIGFQLHKSSFAYDKFDGVFWAEGTFDLRENTLLLNGKIEAMDLLSDFVVESNLKTLDVALYNTKIQTLATLIDAAGLPPAVSEWVYGRILAESYYLDYLYLPIDLEAKKPLLNHLEAKAILDRGNVLFHKELARLITSEIEITLHDGNLAFASKDGRYRDTDVLVLGGIRELFSKPLLHLEITSATHLDATLHEILKGYNIPLEFLKQVDGENDSRFTMEMGLGDERFGTEVTAAFRSALFDLAGQAIRSQKGTVVVKGPEVRLSNINLAYGELADINVTGLLDLKQKNLASVLHINDLNVADRRLVDMHGFVTDLNVTFDKEVKVKAPALNTELRYDKGALSVTVDDVSPYVDNSVILKTLDINKGNLAFYQKGPLIKAEAHVDSNGTSLMQDGKVITHFDATYYQDETTRKAMLNDKVIVNILPERIDVTYSDIDISVSKLIERYTQNEQRSQLVKEQYKEESNGKPLPINLYGTNTHFLYEERILPAEKFNLLVNGDLANLVLENGKTSIKLDKEYDEVTLSAKNIDSNFTKKLFKFEMSEGKANILASGNIKTNEYYGVIGIREATVKGFTLVNNIIAFVNTVPALVTLQNPGFDMEGYTVKKGDIEFFVSGDMLYLTTLRFIGNNTDIIGYGQVNLKNKEVNLTLTLSTIKGLSNLLGKIPLVGYVLLGEDKTIGTLISVTGPLDNPKVETTFAENAALYPFSVIKRTILWPFKLFEDDKETEE